VANVDGENKDPKDPDDLNLSDDELFPMEPTPATEDETLGMVDSWATEAAPLADLTDDLQTTEEAGLPPLESIGVEGEPIAVETAEEKIVQDAEESFDAEIASEGEDSEEKKPMEVPLYAELGGAVGIPVVLLLLALCNLVYFSTAFYLIAVGCIPYAIWKGRETNTTYTALLGCALIAVLTAVYCLVLELGRYDFNVKAKRMGMSRAVQSGLDTTTATACPALVRLTNKAVGLDDGNGSSWMT
jgi:hypothetical protein